MKDNALIDTFTQNARLVSAQVYPVDTLDKAFEKAVELCAAKPDLDPQMASQTALGPGEKIIAAPNLDEKMFGLLADACARTDGISLIRDGLRNYPGGIDMGLTIMNFGIAETGTLVLNARSEQTRLATMLAEWHTAILFTSKIRESAPGMAQELNALIEETGAYTAFITGASRTADIERVLAIGVHGPLELHIILVED